MPKILMIAADFPPCLSAGVQRTYHFAENLLKNDWLPLILTAHPRIYKNLDNKIVVSGAIEKNVRRAFSADASVHFAIKGKYFGFLENPDKMASWYYHGWRVGMSMVKEHQPDVIWSTFPISTAHRIALKLKKKTGIKWVADFRDPLHSHCDDNYKSITDKAKRIDRETVELADVLVFATGKMSELYQSAYPHIDKGKFHVIENGYDEKIFEGLTRTVQPDKKFTLLYSGGLYPHGRDPIPLFKTISRLVCENKLNEGEFLLKFRGSGDGVAYQEVLKELNIKDFVRFYPSIPYEESIQEMKNADGLLVLQGKTFDNQIPGKIYEYIATGNPILALVGCGGASSQLLSTVSNGYQAKEHDVNSIKNALVKLIQNNAPALSNVERFSREYCGSELLKKLNNLLPLRN